MRDILAARAGHHCSKPECGKATSGPAERPDKSASIGVAAHITAASVGGPRYDATLSLQQRSGLDNGIWLCQTDSRLIDADPGQFTVAVLQVWKAEAEALAKQRLSSGVGWLDGSLDLAIPSLDSADSLLSYANTSVAYTGRGKELDELATFLAADPPFSWWLWTGPAGVGKSRLAVEMCRLASISWHAGFLREADQSRLGDLQTLRPSLVVVDYAAQRSAWLSDALAQLSQRRLGAKVRVLVLEREAEGATWWEIAQRKDRMEESVTISATMYALPRRLSGLSRDDARGLIVSTAAQLGRDNLTATRIEDIADHAEHMDPDGRPLFMQIATMDWLDANEGSGGRDDALRRLITRSAHQTGARIGDQSLVALARNTQLFATALGGLAVDEFAGLPQWPELPAGMLPSVYQVFGSIPLNDLLDGVRPDILGELFVLDQLDGQSTTRLVAFELLRLAWLTNPGAYQGFVERAAADHTEHPRLLDLLIASATSELTVEGANLAVAVVRLLKRSNHPVLSWIFERFASIPTHASQDGLDELLVSMRFRFANLVINEGNMQKARELYTEALAQCDPAWPVHGEILNNRGIALLKLGQSEAAVADFSSVIDSPAASNEARACALNNRADVLFEDGEIVEAVAGRSAVLALSDTSYNRRYIALIRRARALQRLGDEAGALQDIDAILASDDIVVEQKMAARLQRAEWFVEADEPAKAQLDLNCIIASHRNFGDVEKRAWQLRATEAN